VPAPFRGRYGEFHITLWGQHRRLASTNCPREFRESNYIVIAIGQEMEFQSGQYRIQQGEILESSRGIRPSRVSRVQVALFAPGLGRLRLLTFPRSLGHFYRGLTAIPHSLRKIWAWGSHLFLENWLTKVAAPTSSEEKSGTDIPVRPGYFRRSVSGREPVLGQQMSGDFAQVPDDAEPGEDF
jgi:hypothetical protein